ncbi:MAG TPA: peptidylprolyl isomerase [Sphingomonas sp.]|nr:peptidylprolyl isomerase [Sphingomonas sp.]
MLRSTLLALLGAWAFAGATAQTPSEIVSQAPAADWVEIPAADLLVMDLAPGQRARPRRVIVQLVPAPFASGHVANIKLLAREHWWDRTSVNRVQDDYVVQWGDASEAKPLPAGLIKVPERDYVALSNTTDESRRTAAGRAFIAAEIAGTIRPGAPLGWHERDAYAPWVDIRSGWPLASDGRASWPVHCYGMVGVGRGLAPDTGTGAELYVVIGHATRQLDRNIAVVGRVIAGIEHLSSLPRGTGTLGFYETAEERVPIVSVRLASELAEAQRPRFEYLSSDTMSFAHYVAARANRKDSFYMRPAGGIDVCNIVPPIRPVKG